MLRPQHINLWECDNSYIKILKLDNSEYKLDIHWGEFCKNIPKSQLHFFKRKNNLEEELFICHIHNYTEYNQQWNVFSAFNPSKCTRTWSSGQPTFGGLLKGLTSVVDNSYRSRNSNPQPRVTSLTLYPLEPWLLIVRFIREVKKRLLMCLGNLLLIKLSCFLLFFTILTKQNHAYF